MTHRSGAKVRDKVSQSGYEGWYSCLEGSQKGLLPARRQRGGTAPSPCPARGADGAPRAMLARVIAHPPFTTDEGVHLQALCPCGVGVRGQVVG